MHQFTHLHISDLTNNYSSTEVDACHQKLVVGGSTKDPKTPESIIESIKQSFLDLTTILPNSAGQLVIEFDASKDGNSFAINSSSTVTSTSITSFTPYSKP